MCQTRFSLELAGDRPDVLHRVLGTCRARGGDVLAVEFTRGDRHRPSRLDVSVDIDPRRRALLRDRLRGLVDVRDVTL